MNKVITIPQKMIKEKELVILPRSEYEEFLQWQKSVKIFKPSAAEKKALREARKDFAKGHYISLEDLRK